MRILGMNYSTNANGEKCFTIQGAFPYDPYYKNTEAGRNCIGERVESVYIGSAFDCSHLKVGMEIEIMFDQARVYNGKTIQKVKRIDIINK